MRQVIRTSTKRKAIKDTLERSSKIVLREIEKSTSVNTDKLLLEDKNQLRNNI